VAVKVIHTSLAAEPAFRARFRREAEAARRVGGFHTAQVVDADPPWIVTAYIPGPSLRDTVQEHGPLPPTSVLTLGGGLAEGLSAVHACGLVHRDLKPANVIVAADGPRIIDFGIVHAVDASTVTASGAVVGTPAYMSPEQARGDDALGPASDVFSFGAVLAFAAMVTEHSASLPEAVSLAEPPATAPDPAPPLIPAPRPEPTASQKSTTATARDPIPVTASASPTVPEPTSERAPVTAPDTRRAVHQEPGNPPSTVPTLPSSASFGCGRWRPPPRRH
jgi:serine/threonine protein kinase